MQEQNGDGRLTNMPGVYVHKESGTELTALSDIQADGLVRMGYEYKGEAQSKADKEATKQAEEITEAPEFAQPEGTGPVGATEKVQDESTEQDTKVAANDDQTDLDKAKKQVPNVTGKRG